jgi:hypothetical protein
MDMRYFFIFIFGVQLTILPGQNSNPVFMIGETTYRKTYSKDFTGIKNLLENYHNQMLSDLHYTGDSWTTQTTLEYPMPDYLLKQELAAYTGKFQIKANLMYLNKMDSFWVAQMAYHLFDNNDFKGLLCVYNFGVVKINNEFKLVPYTNFFKFDYSRKNTIQYYSQENLSSSDKRLDSLDRFNLFLSKVFKTPVIKFKCYNYFNFTEVNVCNGLMVGTNSFLQKDNAYADTYNNIIYTTSFESFFHECVHLYTSQINPNKHDWLDEGIATFLGGCLKNNYKYHLKILHLYLHQHPEINLNNALDYGNKYLSQESSIKTDIGCLIAAIAFERHSYDGLLKLIAINNTSEDFYNGVAGILKTERHNLNAFLREELAKYNQ